MRQLLRDCLIRAGKDRSASNLAPSNSPTCKRYNLSHFVRRLPSDVTVVGCGAVSRSRVCDRGALTLSIDKEVERNLILKCVVSLVGPLANKALEAGHPLCAAERLDVFIQNLIGGKTLRSVLTNLNFVWIVWRSAVLLGKAWRDLGAFSTRMGSLVSRQHTGSRIVPLA